MKKWTIFCLIILFFFTSSLVYAVDYMSRDTRGFDWFSCGAEGRGGLVQVKGLGGTKYRVYSKRFSGDFNIKNFPSIKDRCSGVIGAARFACGQCIIPEKKQRPQSSEDEK